MNWSAIATWVTLFCTIAFNVHFTFIYRNMQQGPLFNTLLTEYSDPGILDSLDLIEDFKTVFDHEDPLEYAYHFTIAKANNTPEGKKLDHARRRLVSWYSKVKLFYEFNLLSKSYQGVVPGRTRTLFFLSIVEPMDRLHRQLDGRPESTLFAYFRHQYDLPLLDLKIDWNRIPKELQNRQERLKKMRENIGEVGPHHEL